MFPALDLYYADPAQPLTAAGEELNDLSDLSDLSVRRVKSIRAAAYCCTAVAKLN